MTVDTVDPRVPPPLTVRVAQALPDGLTAGFFLLLWIAPGILPEGALRTGMLMMLVEFILLHATAMIGGMVMAPTGERRGLWKPLLGFGAFYLLFVAAWSWQFRAWWPFLAFGWLLVSKAWMLMQPVPPEQRRLRMQSDWALATLFYLAGVFMGVFVPIPRLGLDGATISAAALPGSGLWVSKPQTVVALGLFYFGMLALARLRDWQLPADNRASRGR